MNTSVTAQLGSSGAQEVRPTIALTDIERIIVDFFDANGVDVDYDEGEHMLDMLSRVNPEVDISLTALAIAISTAINPPPSHSGQKIADIEILQQKLEFAEWEWNRATEGMKERDAKIALLESLVEGAIGLNYRGQA